MSPFEQLQSEVQLLVGKPCWAVIGPSAGSWFSMDIGIKYKRPKPVKNLNLSEEKQNYIGEYSLLIQHIGWRISQGKECICHSDSPVEKGGPMTETFALLEGKTVEKVEFDRTPDRMTIALSDNLVILTRARSQDPKEPCYIYFVHDVRTFSVYADRVEIQQPTQV